MPLPKLFIAMFFLLSVPQLAAAQDVSWKLSEMKRGDYVAITVRFKGGNIENGVGYTVYTGKKGRHFVTETYQGSGAEAELLITNYRDKEGNSVRAVYPDGFEFRYRPHNCARVLGQCRYAVTLSDGRKEESLLVNGLEGDRVVWKKFDTNDKLVGQGWFEIDKYGSPLRSSTVGEDGRRRDVVAAKAHYN